MFSLIATVQSYNKRGLDGDMLCVGTFNRLVPVGFRVPSVCVC